MDIVNSSLLLDTGPNLCSGQVVITTFSSHIYTLYITIIHFEIEVMDFASFKFTTFKELLYPVSLGEFS